MGAVHSREDKEIARIVHQLSFHPDERIHFFVQLPVAIRASIFLHLTRHVQRDIANKLSDDGLMSLLEKLDPDEVADVLQVLPEDRRSRIMALLGAELKKGVSLLVQFDPDSAAGLMNIDYVLVEETQTIASVSKEFRTHEKRTGRLPTVLVNRNGKVVGYVPGHELGFAKPTDTIKKYVNRIFTIAYDADKDEVIRTFREHPHSKIVVVGELENVLGIIYSDDVLPLLEANEAASLYGFAGVHAEETVTDDTWTKVLHRYRWLILNLGTAFLAALTVSLFDETIAKYVLLAVYMPIVAGMGGNAATQTLAVLVRGIALKEISLENSWPTLKREMGAGFINGVINGVIVALVVFVINRDVMIALVLALAMVINLVVASFFGTMVPLVMERYGKDPATSATVLITTATDVLGFLAFLGLAALLFA